MSTIRVTEKNIFFVIKATMYNFTFRHYFVIE